MSHERISAARAPLPNAHPYDPLTALEIEAATACILDHFTDERPVIFSSIFVVEPPRTLVWAYEKGEAPRPVRRLRAQLLEKLTVRTFEVTVVLSAPKPEEVAAKGAEALPSARYESEKHIPGVQPSFSQGEYEACEEAVRTDERLRAWCAERQIDVNHILVECWASGWFGPEDDATRRLVRPLLYLRSRPHEHSNPFGRPLDGLLPVVDLVEGRVIRWVRWSPDHPIPPAADEHAEYDRSFWPPEKRRAEPKPIVITQPDGPSFEVDGYLVKWQGYTFRVDFTQREGLVLHNITFGGRMVCARMSFNEMVVPYGDPKPPNVRKNAFDAGEDGLGNSANSLELGCDCVGHIRYFDAVVTDRMGRAVDITRAVCMHEEDDGVLWTHVDWRTDRKEARRSRILVLQFTATVANYDYIFAFHLKLDGTIDGIVKMTGILSTSTLPPGAEPVHGTLVAPQLNAPIHQHFFAVRIDAAVDGDKCNVLEMEVETDPPGPHNRRRNAFRVRSTPIMSENMGGRDCDNRVARHWIVQSESRKNRLGQPTAYRLMPGLDVRPLMDPSAPVLRRASFLQHQVWITQTDTDRRYVSGDYPNQRRGSNGVAEWIAENRSLENVPISLWYVMGFTHVVAVENWPIMNIEHVGFRFQPFGFSDCNPCLDLPPPNETKDYALSVAVDGPAPCATGACPKAKPASPPVEVEVEAEADVRSRL